MIPVFTWSLASNGNRFIRVSICSITRSSPKLADFLLAACCLLGYKGAAAMLDDSHGYTTNKLTWYENPIKGKCLIWSTFFHIMSSWSMVLSSSNTEKFEVSSGEARIGRNGGVLERNLSQSMPLKKGCAFISSTLLSLVSRFDSNLWKHVNPRQDIIWHTFTFEWDHGMQGTRDVEIRSTCET